MSFNYLSIKKKGFLFLFFEVFFSSSPVAFIQSFLADSNTMINTERLNCNPPSFTATKPYIAATPQLVYLKIKATWQPPWNTTKHTTDHYPILTPFLIPKEPSQHKTAAPIKSLRYQSKISIFFFPIYFSDCN